MPPEIPTGLNCRVLRIEAYVSHPKKDDFGAITQIQLGSEPEGVVSGVITHIQSR